MAQMDPATGDFMVKLAYLGPAGGGKLASLRYLFDRTPPARRLAWGECLHDTVESIIRCVFVPDRPDIDDRRLQVHLFCTPGRPCYSTTQHLVHRGADGVVFVADCRAERIAAALEVMDILQDSASHPADLYPFAGPLVMQYTHVDAPTAVSVGTARCLLNPWGAPEVLAAPATGLGVASAVAQCIDRALASASRLEDSAQPSSPAAQQPRVERWPHARRALAALDGLELDPTTRAALEGRLRPWTEGGG